MWLAIVGFAVFLISALMISTGVVLHYVSAQTKTTGTLIASKGGVGMLVFLALMIGFTISFQSHKLEFSQPVQILIDIVALAVGILAVFFSPGGWIFRDVATPPDMSPPDEQMRTKPRCDQ